MNESNSRVSVVIPVYNTDAYLAQALKSVFNQEVQPMEVIVVDDGSTDNSAMVAADYSDVRLIRQQNQGVSVARNTGVAAAEGDFIAFLDADDIWAPNKVRVHLDYHLKHPEIGYSVAGMRNFLSDDAQSPSWLASSEMDQDRVGYLPGNLFVTRTTLQRVGSFNPLYRSGEGADWFARAKDVGVSMAILPEILLYRRVHATNQTHDLGQLKTGVLRALKASIDRQKRKDSKDKDNNKEMM